MAASSPPTGKYNVIARLFELMNNVSEDRLLLILKDLLQSELMLVVLLAYTKKL